MNNTPSKILIVDDEKRNIALLEALLSDKGYMLFLANSGYACLDILSKTSDIDLILLDIVMPGSDGFEVCRSIKSNKDTKEIPIIFLTALNDESSQVEGFLAGGVDYISKPFKKEILFARIRTHIELKANREKLILLLDKQEKLIEDLNIALANVKSLQGLLHVCSSCKRIRDEQGQWEKIEEYLKKNTATEFSHSICPDCARSLYPGLKNS